MNFVCEPCREADHEECVGTEQGKTWCDCQHRERDQAA